MMEKQMLVMILTVIIEAVMTMRMIRTTTMMAAVTTMIAERERTRTRIG